MLKAAPFDMFSLMNHYPHQFSISPEERRAYTSMKHFFGWNSHRAAKPWRG